VLVEDIQDAEDAYTVSIFPMRPARDVRKRPRPIATSEVGWLVAAGRVTPFDMPEIDDNAEGNSGTPRPPERRPAGMQGRPIIMFMIHPRVQLREYITMLCGHMTPP
jgi:hypothetical protein